MPTGPYDTNLQRFVECANKTLEKDKEYTIHQAALLCGMHPATVHNYVFNELMEVNLRMPAPKRIVPKMNCGCHEGFIVDPPAASGERSRLLLRCSGVAGGSILALDGARRLNAGNQLGAVELSLGLGIRLLSIFI